MLLSQHEVSFQRVETNQTTERAQSEAQFEAFG